MLGVLQDHFIFSSFQIQPSWGSRSCQIHDLYVDHNIILTGEASVFVTAFHSVGGEQHRWLGLSTASPPGCWPQLWSEIGETPICLTSPTGRGSARRGRQQRLQWLSHMTACCFNLAILGRKRLRQFSQMKYTSSERVNQARPIMHRQSQHDSSFCGNHLRALSLSKGSTHKGLYRVTLRERKAAGHHRD